MLYTNSRYMGRASVTVWYYSLTATGKLRRLTADNLAKDFPNKPALAQAVATDKALQFNLGAIDKADGRLRIVKLLSAQLN